MQGQARWQQGRFSARTARLCSSASTILSACARKLRSRARVRSPTTPVATAHTCATRGGRETDISRRGVGGGGGWGERGAGRLHSQLFNQPSHIVTERWQTATQQASCVFLESQTCEAGLPARTWLPGRTERTTVAILYDMLATNCQAGSLFIFVESSVRSNVPNCLSLDRFLPAKSSLTDVCQTIPEDFTLASPRTLVTTTIPSRQIDGGLLPCLQARVHQRRLRLLVLCMARVPQVPPPECMSGIA